MRLATQAEVHALRLALDQAADDEHTLYAAGLVHLHDELFDACLMGTMDRVMEGRPMDPDALCEAMGLLAHHHGLAAGCKPGIGPN